MRQLLPAVLFLALLAIPAAAHADNIVTLNASGTFQSGSTLSGSFTLDQTTGTVTSVDFIVSAPDSLDFTYLQSYSCTAYAGNCVLFTGPTASGLPNLNIGVAATSLVGYDGGAIAGPSNVYFSATDDDFIVSGTFSPAPTPEPASLVLLATGLCGIVAATRRKLTA